MLNTVRLQALKAVEDGARALGVKLQVYEVGDPNDLDGAFAAMTRAATHGDKILKGARPAANRTRGWFHVPRGHGVPLAVEQIQV
ncbi:MAG: hypothetical protein HYZ81_02895 [Nitrospinae bacterium]|nr:hypothetical protein [Nitrospinota bacterium]